jgi:hypothetical protein
VQRRLCQVAVLVEIAYKGAAAVRAFRGRKHRPEPPHKDGLHQPPSLPAEGRSGRDHGSPLSGCHSLAYS